MKKNVLPIIATVATTIIMASCSKQCTCTATLNGQTVDQVVYEDMNGKECEAQTDITLQELMQNYDPQSLVGLEISCSHL